RELLRKRSAGLRADDGTPDPHGARAAHPRAAAGTRAECECAGRGMVEPACALLGVASGRASRRLWDGYPAVRALPRSETFAGVAAFGRAAQRLVRHRQRV